MEIRGKFKDAYGEKAPSNKTQALTKSMNRDIWVVGTLKNKLFMRGCYTEIKFSKKIKELVRQNTVLCQKSILYSPFCLS